MAANAHPFLVNEPPQVRVAENLSIALISPDAERRLAVSREVTGCTGGSVHEYSVYPIGQEAVQQVAAHGFDAILIDLDRNPEYALALAGEICAVSAATVMMYSTSQEPNVILRAMRSGAREFLTLPISGGELANALLRAAARRTAKAAKAQKAGKQLVFLGAKGGVGVTSVACNFAVALAQEPERRTLLIDFDLPLGDVALNLGIIPELANSTVSALKEIERLDANLLSKLVVQHSSGVFVLTAPGKFPTVIPTPGAIEKLLAVARQEFDNVVVDAGTQFNLSETAMFTEATTVYLVMQAGIPELRNANRLVGQFATTSARKLEVVLNRYESRTLGVSEEHITKALTRPADWKIPDDHDLMRKMQNNATPVVPGNSSVARQIKKIANSVYGEPEEQPKRMFGLF